MSTYIEC